MSLPEKGNPPSISDNVKASGDSLEAEAFSLSASEAEWRF
jgi:hypothetical protein